MSRPCVGNSKEWKTTNIGSKNAINFWISLLDMIHNDIDNTPLPLLGGVTPMVPHADLSLSLPFWLSDTGKWFFTLCRDIWAQKHINRKYAVL
jgi:hypothetical protein